MNEWMNESDYIIDIVRYYYYYYCYNYNYNNYHYYLYDKIGVF